jgi:hypothetical protein
MSDKGWTTADPLLVQVRATIRRHKRIDEDVLIEAACNRAELRVIMGAFKDLKHAHPKRWRSREMTGSLLKRIRRLKVAA